MSCPDEIRGLIERFKLNLEAYRSGQYNETQLRREFLDPFFTALGWDVENKQGYAEAYKDVIHEDAIKVGGATKAPDYCFRIGGTRKFFVEAKKPSVSLKDEISPAYQLRRYAWSAKLPLSILTDFEEFAVYDCRVKPSKSDSAATARTIYIQSKEFEERWDEIASKFSREAVLKGSFDKYIESTKAKKGTAEVDDAFLKEIEAWRDSLARTIALRNPKLSQRELNFAVQRTIDRMIFLRICEDRGIETYGALMALLNGEHAYKRLCELFHRADEKYNSGLFHFRKERERLEEPDELTLGLNIDDKPLKEIIRNLYYPDSPYEFSVLPADILGQVYEQFLGKVIRLTAGHRAVVEDKPEVKKAGGVYYTPTYIVDYIVKNTVGKLLSKNSDISRVSAGKDIGIFSTPKQVSTLRILDPACGSGSFLIGAYQYLLDWHRDWYVNDGPEKWATGRSPALFQVSGGDWRLTTAERKRILLNNIYGVDIDPQAVEVTKLSLLLKVLEGENEQTISRQLRMFHERALPDLGSNIKCGNSLIGPDFYEGKQLSLLDEEERLRINVFDWKKEFPEIFAPSPQGEGRGEVQGFDAVIGNPPWGAEIDRSNRHYLSQKYPGVADFESSQYFLMRTVSLLNGRGLIGMIIPNTFALNVYARRCRETILESALLTTMVDLSEVDVFAGPNVRSMIVVLSQATREDCRVLLYEENQKGISELRSVTQQKLKEAETWKEFLVKETSLSRLVSRLVKVNPTLADYCEVRQGYIPYRTSTLTRRLGRIKAEELVRNRSWHSKRRESSEYLRELQGADVGRYEINWSGTWVRYGEWVSTYLPLSVFSGPRILVREITGPSPRSLLSAYSEETFVHNPSVLAVLPRSVPVSIKFILGILNSRLMSTIFMAVAPKAKKGLFPKIIITDARRLPVPRIELSKALDISRHDHMVEMVEQMLALHKSRLVGTSVKTEHEKTALQRQIDLTDKQIDELVYELYSITEEEKKIIEGTDV